MRHNLTSEELETHIRLAEPIEYGQGSPERMRGIRRDPGNIASQIALVRYYTETDESSLFLKYVDYIVKNPNHTGIKKWGMSQEERDDFYGHFNNIYLIPDITLNDISYNEALKGFYIVRLNNPAPVLNFTDKELTGHTIHKLLEFLPFLNVVKINFYHNVIGIINIHYLERILTDPDNIITSLCFRECSLGDHEIITLMKLLSHANCKVNELDISGNIVQRVGMRAVIDTIKNPNCRLVSLKFPTLLHSFNNNELRFSAELAPAMRANYSLTSVSLDIKEINTTQPPLFEAEKDILMGFTERNKRIAAWLVGTEVLLNSCEVNTSFRSSFSALKMGASSHYNRKWKTDFLEMKELFITQVEKLNALNLSKQDFTFLECNLIYKAFEKRITEINLQSILFYFKDRPLDEIPAILYQINELDNQYTQKLVLQYLNFLNGIRDHIALAENDMRDIYLISFWIAYLIDDEELLLHHINRIEDSLLGIERFELDFYNIPEAEYTRAHPEYQTKVVTPLMVMAKELHLPLDVSALESAPIPPMHTSSPS